MELWFERNQACIHNIFTLKYNVNNVKYCTKNKYNIACMTIENRISNKQKQTKRYFLHERKKFYLILGKTRSYIAIFCN